MAEEKDKENITSPNILTQHASQEDAFKICHQVVAENSSQEPEIEKNSKKRVRKPAKWK